MKLLPSLALSALCAAAAAPVAAATFDARAVALTLSDDGRSIVTIAGSGVGAEVALTLDGVSEITLDDIDYRPKTGGLYGYDNETASVYLIDPTTGALTRQVTMPGVTSSDTLGFDFNNRIDAARVVSTSEDNVVYDPKPAVQTLTVQTDLFYKTATPTTPADVNAGKNPNVIMNAYTNAVPDAPTTVQYVIDTALDVLGILNNNAGDITTVGRLFLDGFAFDARGDGGFDILSFFAADGTTILNTAYALLTTGNTQALYTFGLTADANGQINLMKVADVDAGLQPVAGLTVIPSPVPVPATALLLLGGLGLLGAAARKRRA